MDRGARWATAHRVTESDTTEQPTLTFHFPSLDSSPGAVIYSCICFLDGCSLPHCFLRATDLFDEYLLGDLVNEGTPSNELHRKGGKKVSLSEMNIQLSKIPVSIPGEGKSIQTTELSSFQTRVCSCLGLSLSPSIPNFAENGQFFSFNVDFYMP